MLIRFKTHLNSKCSGKLNKALLYAMYCKKRDTTYLRAVCKSHT